MVKQLRLCNAHMCQKDQQLSKTVPGLQTSLKSVSKILKLPLKGNVFVCPLHKVRHFIQGLFCPGWRHWSRQFCITSCFKWGWDKLSSYAWVIAVLLRWAAFYIENHPLLSRCSVESTLPRTAIPMYPSNWIQLSISKMADVMQTVF